MTKRLKISRFTRNDKKCKPENEGCLKIYSKVKEDDDFNRRNTPRILRVEKTETAGLRMGG